MPAEIIELEEVAIFEVSDDHLQLFSSAHKAYTNAYTCSTDCYPT